MACKQGRSGLCWRWSLARSEQGLEVSHLRKYSSASSGALYLPVGEVFQLEDVHRLGVAGGTEEL